MTEPRNDAPGDELEPETEPLEAEDDDLEPAAPRRAARAEGARAEGARSASGARGRPAFAIDPALRIRDRTSTVFVAGSTLAFLGIFLYAMAFGKGGAFTPVRTPPPIVSPSPGASPTAAPTSSVEPSASAAPTSTVAPSSSAVPSPSVEPSSSAAPASAEPSPAAS